MAAGDRLSELCDDLLRRILYFAPAKEAASTSALARRWRWLWRSSGAVNLDKRSYSHVDRYVFLDDADAALAGHHVPVRKLTFRYVEGEDDDPFAHEESMSYEDDVHDALLDMADCLERLLCSPAARHVEDLCFGIYFGPAAHTPGSGRLYSLRIGDLPSRALRVLHMSKCMDFARVVVAPFPRLVELRLHLCYVSLETLQGVIDAAPLLATLHLDGAEVSCYSGSLVRLRCPKVATLGMDNFNFQTMELHAPALRCFTYKGPVRAFTLLPQDTMNRTRVDLQFQVPRHQGSDDQTCTLFWHFVQNFSNANIIKLSVRPPDLFYYHWRDLYVPISN